MTKGAMTKTTSTKASSAPAVATVASAPQHPLRAIRRAGVPIAAFETSDPAATIAGCKKVLNGKFDEQPVLQWDLLRGFIGLNKRGVAVAADLGGETVLNPAEALGKLAVVKNDSTPVIPPKTLCFMLNAHRLISDSSVAQGFWNVRDIWKEVGATLILLCPTIKLPEELTHDIVIVTEPLPTTDEIGFLVDAVINSVSTPENPIQVKDKSKVVDALLGVSAFAAEQALSMSITRDGINSAELLNRKRKMVEQTPGLSILSTATSFDNIGGLNNIKSYLSSILSSPRNPVRAIGFIDEIEKLFAGSGSDTSGVSQDQLKVFLTAMQDENIPGIILIGPPGTGKSEIAKGAGAVAGAEVISIDTGAMTGSLVGESQAKIRKAMQTFSAVSQGKGLFIATCNSINSLPPELRRRFTLGTFFVDLPNKEERDSIWKVWLKRYESQGLVDTVRPNDDGWTGAEIRACCDVAWRADLTLVEAAKFIVPVAKSAGDKIESLRKMASGKFISATYEGVYESDKKETVMPAVRPTRRIDLGDS